VIVEGEHIEALDSILALLMEMRVTPLVIVGEGHSQDLRQSVISIFLMVEQLSRETHPYKEKIQSLQRFDAKKRWGPSPAGVG
jgi:hypothetical protein